MIASATLPAGLLAFASSIRSPAARVQALAPDLKSFVSSSLSLTAPSSESGS